MITLENLTAAGGLSAEMKVINVAIPSNNNYPRRYILKHTRTGGLERSKQMGSPREALFYQSFAETLRNGGCPIPEIIVAHGDMTTGEKVLVIEDLSYYGVQSGYFFGPGSPLNWGHDLAAKTAKVPNIEHITAMTIASDTLQAAAKMHRIYWKDESLLHGDVNRGWLRGNYWLQGKGQEMWIGAQNTAKFCWKGTKDKIANGTSTVQWNPLVLDVIDASLAKADWETYSQQLQTRAWTLVHGDLHPANIMWVWHDETHPHTAPNGQGRSMFIDWEMVGLGSGPQDVAQYLISHTTPVLRKTEEERLVREYYHTLTEETQGRVNSETYTFEQCWADYKSGGSERWVWLLAVLSSMCPDKMNQYFHDQFLAFLQDHEITVDTIGMPRV